MPTVPRKRNVADCYRLKQAGWRVRKTETLPASNICSGAYRTGTWFAPWLDAGFCLEIHMRNLPLDAITCIEFRDKPVIVSAMISGEELSSLVLIAIKNQTTLDHALTQFLVDTGALQMWAEELLKA